MIHDPWRTTPRGAAVTIVGIGSLVGLVGWPRETAYALSALAGLLALVGGILKLRGELAVREPAEGPADQPDGERCCVCGGPDTPYENYRGQLFCWPCANCPCGQVPCVRTGINDLAVSADAAGRCAGCPGCGGPDCIQRPDASGQHPETARTDPDALGSDAADQDGHHPDDADTAVPTMAPTYPPLDPTTPPTPHWDDPTRDLRMATGTPVPTVCRLIAAMAEKATEHQLTDAEVQHLFDAATAVGHIEVRLHTHVCGQGDGE